MKRKITIDKKKRTEKKVQTPPHSQVKNAKYSNASFQSPSSKKCSAKKINELNESNKSSKQPMSKIKLPSSAKKTNSNHKSPFDKISNINNNQENNKPNIPRNLSSQNKLILTEDIDNENGKNSFDENYLNNILMQLTQNINLINNNNNDNNNKSNNNSNNLNNNLHKNKKNKIQKFSSYQNDFSLFKTLQIEISYNKKKCTKEQIDNFNKKINDYFTQNQFEYYSFSNSKNILSVPSTECDQISYEGMFQNDFQQILSCGKIKNKLDILKTCRQINYISAMKSLNKQCITNKKYFYFTTPMHTFYFNSNPNDKIKNELIGSNYNVILSRKTTLENLLENNNIKYEEIINDNLNNSNDVIMTSNDNEIEYPVKINFANKNLTFNTIINEYENKYFNIFAPFYFEESVYHQCKIYVKFFERQNYNVVDIQIYGCIFQDGLNNIIKFLCNDKNFGNCYDSFSFNIKLFRIYTTNNFYLINKNLKGCVTKIEYAKKDKEFILTVKS